MKPVLFWAIVLAVLLFLITPIIVFADDGTSVIPPTSWLYTVWTIIEPIVMLLVTIFGPAALGVIAAYLIKVLKITDETKKAALEASLRDALHQAALNGLKFALTKAGVSAAVLPSASVLADAVTYVQSKNPDTLTKLGVGLDDLQHIILSKVPDVTAAATSPAAT